MSTFTKVVLSGSTSGMGKKIAGTGTGSADTIHTADASAFDEVWLYAFNSSASDVVLTIEFGDATLPDHNIIATIPSKNGLNLIVPGLILTGSKIVKAFAATTNVVTLTGYVNRIS